ncbi:MAG TPA: sialidase family protein [Verrucomicrobiae bacterium]|nr:sialidase family protein [Verrucomicrobiae bacterium]
MPLKLLPSQTVHPTFVARLLWCLIPMLIHIPVASADAAPRIALEDFRIEPMSLRPNESFVVRARAVAKGIALGSFLLRTADQVKAEDALPGFPLRANGYRYVAEGKTYHISDNGSLDRDKSEGGIAIEISTRGWKPGRYPLAFFASSRPAPGPFVAARHDFAVTVGADKVSIEDLGGNSLAKSRAIADFAVTPGTIAAGQAVELTVRFTPETIASFEVGDALHVAPSDVLPGFSYDTDKRRSFLKISPNPSSKDATSSTSGTLSHQFDTRGWAPGAHHLLLQALGPSGRAVDERPFAIKVIGPKDHLQVTVEPSTLLGPGTHFGRFLRLRDGTLFCADQVSRDGGRTWQQAPGGFGEGAEQFRDGSVIGLAYRCLPIKDRDGWYSVARYTSKDGLRFETDQAEMFVPEAKGAMGHGPHVGPLFMRSLLERTHGSLVAYMAGWFKSDTALCPYGHGRPYSRSYTCESADGGRTWRYLSTIGYEPIGSEGYNEGSMRSLPDGSWLAVMRTGNASDLNCQDNPIMWSASRDEGRTWSKPQRTGLQGCYPSLAVLGDGSLVMSYGRPGAMIAFSADGGRTWTDITCVDATTQSGYTDVVEIESGLLLVGFGTRGYLDPSTRERTDGLRLARVRCASR